MRRPTHRALASSYWKLVARVARRQVLSLVPRRNGFEHYDARRYRAWVARHDTLDEAGREALRHRLAGLADPPLVSVAMATYETPERYLREAIASVQAQIYPHWELCIADDASASPDVRRILAEEAGADERIKVTYRERNGHISAALNSALALAAGEFVAFLDHDDRLPENALAEVALELGRHPDAELVYSDEDKLDTRGRRCEPYFKPDWNPELLESANYVCHLTVLRRELVDRVGGLREGFEGSQDYDLVLRATGEIDDPDRIRHIPRVLYHWRRHWRSTAMRQGSKSYAFAAAERALAERHAEDGVEVEAGPVPGTYHLRHPLPARPPLVTLIVPTRDGHERLRRCVESIETQSTYRHRELLVVDNGSTNPDTRDYLAELATRAGTRVLSYGGRFNFSAINNLAAGKAKGDVLAFVNDDVEAVSRDWLEEMLGHAVRAQIGAVGAKLTYPDGRIQHAGVALGIGGVAGHTHRRFPDGDPGYFSRLVCTQAVSAVTAACMLLRREVFEAAGGFDEENLAIAFNDIDLCLRVRELGFRNVWTPYAVLRHAESSSRGYERTPSKRIRFAVEARYMKRRWGSALVADPYYNPNLTLDSEDLQVANVPRTPSSVGAPASPAQV
jgi:O-antigen biosynthesis protein